MQRVQTPEDKLSELEITLPAIRPAVGNYVSCVRVGNLLFTAGQGVDEYHGKLGKDISIDEGYKAARQSMLNLLSVVRNELGDLNKVKRIVKILGFVNSTEDFINQPKVMNGASDVLVDIFGEKGKHARSAVGMAQLPNNTTIEIEMILEIEE
ncbi:MULTISPECIES: RidA family protein [Bacillus]|uniref:Endoribonuclease L-PSP n=1 Tax=Bacillus anthracis TaxID=1392 RepID=A0A0J1I168_BACAN|nr:MULTISPECIES: RidA family protein [Bacillus]EDX67991.1 endoribonuclease L-PSP [Bacillus cereus NVH0597-99]MRB20896.1 RidA family protein [Bacillus thuringiensis]KLV19732.1 endoribonuclease L-PSP [Bacillus anthracis]MCU4796077.1 RidA family protein [Bacillus cereus]MDA1613617.1 RidA family protein [Bacillus cereus]